MDEDKFLVNRVGIYLLLSIFILAIIIIACFVITKSPEIFYGLLPIVPLCVLVIITRKYCFSTIILSNYGIEKNYNGKTLLKLEWDEVNVVKTFPYSMIYFLKQDMTQREVANNGKHLIYFQLNKANFKKLLKYKNFYKSKLKELSGIPPYYKNTLIQ